MLGTSNLKIAPKRQVAVAQSIDEETEAQRRKHDGPDPDTLVDKFTLSSFLSFIPQILVVLTSGWRDLIFLSEPHFWPSPHWASQADRFVPFSQGDASEEITLRASSVSLVSIRK